MSMLNNGNQWQNTGDRISNPNFFDIIFRMKADDGIKEMAKKGVKAIKDIKQSASDTFQAIVDEEYAKMCLPILTMNDCLTWVKTQKMIYPQGRYFFIYVEENPVPRNENDNFSVAIALLDEYKKPIFIGSEKKSLFSPDFTKSKNNQDIVCLVVPVGNIDNKLIKTLNGTPSVLVQL
ncbi:MAG: hypothetical protein J6A58_09375 [Oscillospiraceae bacterium]|nr:hypothetical protein [Oscillospiraceae bacterium]